jgi:hypothetical protein
MTTLSSKRLRVTPHDHNPVHDAMGTTWRRFDASRMLPDDHAQQV